MPVDILVSFRGDVGRTIGGTSANVALILAFLGWDASLAGQLGDDVLADEFVREATEAGARTDFMWRASGAETVRIVHRVDADGHSYAYTCPRCHSRFPRSRPLTLEQAHAVHSSLPIVDVYFLDRVNAATVWLAERYAAGGAVVMFEPSLPTGGALFARACKAASVIKSSAEIDLPFPDRTPSDRTQQVRVRTDGAKGLSFTVGPSAAHHLPAIPTLSVDTAGAGDWTTAGLLHHAVRAGGLDLARVESGLRLGQSLAAMCCSVMGARSLMRLTRQTVLRRAKAVLQSNSLESALRIPELPPRTARRGHCSLCTMPT